MPHMNQKFRINKNVHKAIMKRLQLKKKVGKLRYFKK